jgi:hypothetical protein
VIGARPPRVTVEQVRAIMDQPPYWLAGSYLPAYKSGRYSLEVLAYGVTAALRHSSYDGEVVDEVVSVLEGLGYGDEGVTALWV